MINQPWSAESVKRIAEEQAKKEKQIQAQMNELHQQTSTLSDVKELTKINIDCIKNIVNLTSENTETVKQIAQMTEENQKSSTKQFIASIIVSAAALIIAFSSLIISILQLYK